MTYLENCVCEGCEVRVADVMILILWKTSALGPSVTCE